jgi:type II secretory pathway component PulJ
MKMKKSPQQSGETLMGLLVGLAIGLTVLAAGTLMLAQLMQGHRRNLQTSHLQQDLRVAMDWMARELRHAQYSAKAWQTRSPSRCIDPFCDDPKDSDGYEDFSILKDWIDFSFDRNHNGEKDDNECTGFRLADNAVMVKRSCKDGGQWQPMTSPQNIVITDMHWELLCTLTQGWFHRSVRLSVSGHWPGNASQKISLEQTIELRNDLPAVVQEKFCT